MINRYVVLMTSLAVLFAGYAVWWHGEAGRMEKQFPAILAKALPPGATLQQTVAGVDGFPFRLNVQLTDVKLSWGVGDSVATTSLTGIFQPFTGDHLILHMDAPISFNIEGATGTLDADRALASMVGYEGGHYQLDADSMNVTLEQPGVARLTAARAQGHVRREIIGDPGKYAFAVSAKGVTPKDAATGHLAQILAKFGEVQKDGTVDLDIDEKDEIFHAKGKELAPEDAGALKTLF
jgi:hypothetical protein